MNKHYIHNFIIFKPHNIHLFYDFKAFLVAGQVDGGNNPRATHVLDDDLRRA